MADDAAAGSAADDGDDDDNDAHQDSSANGDHDSDKYDTCGDDDDDGDGDDAGDDDEDSTLVKQSVSTAAAATGTEQHLESLIADLQQKLETLQVDKSALESTKEVLEVELAAAREQMKLEVEQRKQADTSAAESKRASREWKAKYQLMRDKNAALELLLCDVYQRLEQVEADKTELQQQLERMGSDTGWLFSGCSETANYQHDENCFPKTFREAFRGIRSALENRLDTSHGLLDELLQRCVLLPAHYEDICESANNDYDRADRLMNILERRRDSLLSQFYCALEATDQRDLVQLIRYKDEHPPCAHKAATLKITEDDTEVWGATSLGDRIYVVCDKSDVIAVFTSQQPFSRLADIVVNGLHSPFDIAASVNVGCLYVPGPLSLAVWRVNVDNGAAVEWLTGLWAETVSVTSEDRVVLLVAVDEQGNVAEDNVTWLGEIHVYSRDAVIETLIKLSPDIRCPLSVVMTTRKTFIVSYDMPCQPVSRVCEVDMTGRELKAFGGSSGPGVGQLDTPSCVSVDDEERIIVADSYNNRVLMLNKQLTSPRVLVAWHPQSQSDKADRPCTLHYDSHTGSLLVGLFSGHVDVYRLK